MQRILRTRIHMALTPDFENRARRFAMERKAAAKLGAMRAMLLGACKRISFFDDSFVQLTGIFCAHLMPTPDLAPAKLM